MMMRATFGPAISAFTWMPLFVAAPLMRLRKPPLALLPESARLRLFVDERRVLLLALVATLLLLRQLSLSQVVGVLPTTKISNVLRIVSQG